MNDPSSKNLKVLCSFDGRLRHRGKLRYTGGETRIISVDPNTLTYSILRSKISQLFRPGKNPAGFSLKYLLPGDSDGLPLVLVASDDDILCMVEEFQCGEVYGKPSRLRLFVYNDDDVDDDDDDNLVGSGLCRGFVVKHGGRRVSDHNCLRKLVLKQSLLAKQHDFDVEKYDEIVNLGGMDRNWTGYGSLSLPLPLSCPSLNPREDNRCIGCKARDESVVSCMGSCSVGNQELGFSENQLVGSQRVLCPSYTQNHRVVKLDGKNSVYAKCYPGLGSCSCISKQGHNPIRVINPDFNDRTSACEHSGDYKHIVSYEKFCETIITKEESCFSIPYGGASPPDSPGSREIFEDLHTGHAKPLNPSDEANEVTETRASNVNELHLTDDITEKTPSEEMQDHSNATPSISDNVDRGRSHNKSWELSNLAVFHTHLGKELQKINDSDLEYIKELASGKYGTVYYGKWKGSDVAIKKIKPTCFTGDAKEEDRLVADFWKEAHMLGELHHPNIVSLYGVVSEGPTTSLATVTGYMISGSLKQVLQKKGRTIDRRKRLIIAMDVAFGMEYLHEKNIVHFDLKSHNLLMNMSDPRRPVCKIGDLGLSKIKQNTHISGAFRGTIPWMAPELLSTTTNLVTEKVDVYSFGIVMWELLTGEEPYANMRSREILAGLIEGTLRPEIPSWCDPGWRSLMERCWSFDHESRPTFAEVAKELRAMSSAMNIK